MKGFEEKKMITLISSTPFHINYKNAVSITLKLIFFHFTMT